MAARRSAGLGPAASCDSASERSFSAPAVSLDTGGGASDCLLRLKTEHDVSEVTGAAESVSFQPNLFLFLIFVFFLPQEAAIQSIYRLGESSTSPHVRSPPNE